MNQMPKKLLTEIPNHPTCGTLRSPTRHTQDWPRIYREAICVRRFHGLSAVFSRVSSFSSWQTNKSLL